MSIKNLSLIIGTIIIFSSCHVGRTIVWNFGDYDDYKKFDHQIISSSNKPYEFKTKRENDLFFNLKEELPGEYLINNNFEEFLKENNTTSFYVLKRDTILYEKYFNGHKEEELHCVNSVSKSFISLLIGIAIQEGKIKSLDDSISDYITEYKNTELEALTISDIIDMKSGLKFSEQYYNPFGNLSKFYYGKNLRKYLNKLAKEEEPGRFNYISVNTDILGWILERAINQSVPKYLEEKVWIPMEMEYEATWSIDSKRNNVPKYAYGLNTRTKDLLKLGYLYSQAGVYRGKKIINEEWIGLISEIESTDIAQPNYKNHWWRDYEVKEELKKENREKKLEEYEIEELIGGRKTYYKIYNDNYYAAGFLGQFIYVDQEKEIVIVRTGKKQGKTDWIRLFRTITKNI